MLSLLLIFMLAQGVTPDAIIIGMEGEANSLSANEENLGMHLVIKQVNEDGGIHGRQLQVVAYPRGRVRPVQHAVENARRLVEEDSVFLLFNFGGPASVQIGAYAMQNDVPNLFPHTALLTVDGDRHVFTSYPRYAGESRAMLKYLALERNVARIAVIYAPNIYGDYFREQVASLAPQFGYEFVGAQALENDAASAAGQMRILAEGDPDIVLMALYPAGARKAIEAKAALAWDVRLVSTGPLTDERYLNVADGAAEGTIGFCYYPDPGESDAPGIVEYRRQLARYFPGHEPNRYSLYGYVYGKLVVEGLRRAGEELTEAGFLDAMESIHDWQSGGIMPPVSFSSTDHHAQEAGFICELENGRFKPLSACLVPS